MALSHCDDGPSGGGAVVPGDALYIAGCERVKPALQKFDAKTGQSIPGFSPDYPCISADVDTETGRIFIYTDNYLRSYAADGSMLREVRVTSYSESGREYIVYNGLERVVYLLDGRGCITVFNAEHLDVADTFDTPMADSHQFYLEEPASRVWMVSKDRHEARGYRIGRARIVTWATTDGEFWQVAFEPWTDTILIGLTEDKDNYLFRLSPYPWKVEKLPVDIVPRYVTVEPGSGTLWVSNGETTERYAPDGEKLDGLPDFGFEHMVFNKNGSAAFGVDPEGRFCAFRTRDLKAVWSSRPFSPQHDIHTLRYAPLE